ncbi:MAG: phBC6A51 family helix-turn-helix protein [Bacillota bacterium]
MLSRKQIEAKLDNTKKRAALLIVQNDFNEFFDEETGEKRKLTKEEIGEMVGVSRMTLWRYENEPLFIEYVNLLSDQFLKAQRTFVYKQLIKAIGGSQPSVNAIKLYLQAQGLLVDKQVVEHIEKSADKSNEELEKELEELDELLNAE